MGSHFLIRVFEQILIYRKIRIVWIFQNTLLVLVALTVWLIGSLILIQIDMDKNKHFQSKLNAENSLEEGLAAELRTIEKSCQVFDRREIYKLNSKTELSDGEEELLRAKKEKIIRDNLIHIPKLNQMWCLVPKAASTTWSKVLLDHLAIPIPKEGNYTPNQVLLKQKFGYTSKNKFEDAMRDESVQKILLVRHPFARIASAYENKLRDRHAGQDSLYFFQHYGALIYRKYRKDHGIKQREPTFPEFIDYLIDTEPLNYDEHWQPISLLCGLCYVHYNLIIKVEDLQKTSTFILKKLGLHSNSNIPVYNSQTGQRKISTYFKDISKSKMVLLYQKYEMDFKLFNYSFHEFFNV